MFRGQFCANMSLHTTASGHQLEGSLIMTVLESEVIIRLFWGVCIMLVYDLPHDQSLIEAEEMYHDDY